MPDILVIARFERRLVELGCPAHRLAERVRELAEHHEDLKAAAREEGLSEAEAEARASAQLGDPVLLADNSVWLLRRSSWWGRHPIIGFGVLPIMCFVPILAMCWAVSLGVCWLAGRVGPAYRFDSSLAGALSADPKLFNQIAGPLNMGMMLLAMLVTMVLFGWLARRSVVGMKWMLAVCAVCAVDSLYGYSGIHPHSFDVRLGWNSSDWFHNVAYAAIPTVFAGLVWLGRRRQLRRLDWVKAHAEEFAPAGSHRRPAGCRPMFEQPSWLREMAGSPTTWVVTFLILAIAVLVTGNRTRSGHKVDLRAGVWPAERAATLARLQARMVVPVPAGEETINLKPFVNVALTDSVGNVPEDNLQELPAGVHTFGGVTFDVAGRVQLAGQQLAEKSKKFPWRVNHLPVTGKCARIHLLHGANNVTGDNHRIARLVLHYADGSRADLNIISGEQVLDWWGPIYHTDAGIAPDATAPDTELAWAGGNPGIRHRLPDYSLRLYRTTFANPHADREITGLDYAGSPDVKNADGAASFLVGLTVDRVP